MKTAPEKNPEEEVQQQPDLNARDDYFRFTRGRFVCNEAFEMAQRYIRFDMNALSKIAANAVGSDFCVAVEKYPDGMYNKTFLFTTNDGSQVVGKVPNPNAGKPHFTTASEVATMDFVRHVLKTPVPKVFTWSSNAQNPVGAEYIIMEKVAGIQLDQVWASMDIKKKFEVIKSLFQYQKAWMNASFSHVGALYYAEDTSSCRSLSCEYTNRNGEVINDHRYAVGPCVGRGYTDHGRDLVSFDRGPWTSVEDYKCAIGNREIACIQDLPRLPKSPISLRGPGVYAPSREKKIAAVENYLKLVPYLLPTDDSIKTSYLWHPDLHIENIYVNPAKTTEVVGIIDWQTTDLLPLFDHARQPYLLDHDGPEVKGLERPKLAEDREKLPPEERRRALSLYYDQTLVALYRQMTHDQKNVLYRAMEFRDTPGFDMFVFAQNLLVDGEAHYQAHMASFESVWKDLPAVRADGNPPFPLHFSDQELSVIDEDMAAATRGMELMDQVRRDLGALFPEKGIVRHDQYEDAKEALRRAKLKVYEELELNEKEKAEWDLAWPFDE